MKKTKSSLLITLALLVMTTSHAANPELTNTIKTKPTRTIIMVWDGFRPDSINPTDTPNLYQLRQSGVDFRDNHSTYPTFTMMNAAAFATGSFPKTTGFYGNTFWTPPQKQGENQNIPVGNGANGKPADYNAPIFTEDYQVLTTLNNYYDSQLLLVKSLFKTAQEAGLSTAVIGKSGAAYIQNLQDDKHVGYFLDENTVQPRSFAKELQDAHFALPKNITNNYSGNDSVTLATNNDDPTARAGYITFNTTAYDPAGKISIPARDSSDTTQGSPEDNANQYMLKVYTDYILPKKLPDLSLIWFRTPDNAEHGYGPNTFNAKAGVKSQDKRLGELITALKNNHLEESTNLIIVSDHGHSTVSGPLSLYPLRAIIPSATPPNGTPINGSTNGTSQAKVGEIAKDGYSFSGDVRSADLLTYQGFQAFDGSGCTTSAMYGIQANGKPTIPVKVDKTGTLCGTPDTKYQAISSNLAQPLAKFNVPVANKFPLNGIVIAANGGSDYFYLPSHDKATLKKLVKFLQQREEYGAIFVDSRYGNLAGTLPMSMVNLENNQRKGNGQPDVVASFNWENTKVQGLPGIEFESAAGQRGMHGSFSPSDVHNTLIAHGPSFQKNLTVTNPTGNVDVAPTVAHVLGLSMPQADGRIINEALTQPNTTGSISVQQKIIHPNTAAKNLVFETPLDPTGSTADKTLKKGQYSIDLGIKDLTTAGKTYRYFDYAKAVRN